MEYDKEERREQAQTISWWLAPENTQARRELRERNEPLAQWLDMVERKVAERMVQVERV
jgi:hypothetical protein